MEKLGVCVCFAAKKTKKQVFVSYSLPMTDSNLSLLVENRIKKELELHPEHFWNSASFKDMHKVEQPTAYSCFSCSLDLTL